MYKKVKYYIRGINEVGKNILSKYRMQYYPVQIKKTQLHFQNQQKEFVQTNNMLQR